MSARALIVGGRRCGIAVGISLIAALPIWLAASQCKETVAELGDMFFRSQSPPGNAAQTEQSAEEKPQENDVEPAEIGPRPARPRKGELAAAQALAGQQGDPEARGKEPPTGFADFRLGMTRAEVCAVWDGWRKVKHLPTEQADYEGVENLKFTFSDKREVWFWTRDPAAHVGFLPQDRAEKEVILTSLTVAYERLLLPEDARPLDDLRELYGTPTKLSEVDVGTNISGYKDAHKTHVYAWAWPAEDVDLKCWYIEYPYLKKYALSLVFERGKREREAAVKEGDRIVKKEERKDQDAARKSLRDVLRRGQGAPPPPAQQNP